jgi:hypothetical protein
MYFSAGSFRMSTNKLVNMRNDPAGSPEAELAGVDTLDKRHPFVLREGEGRNLRSLGIADQILISIPGDLDAASATATGTLTEDWLVHYLVSGVCVRAGGTSLH